MLKVGIVDTGIPDSDAVADHSREWPMITELRKQYEIDDRPIDLSQPLKGEYDVLVAFQPSMLGPERWIIWSTPCGAGSRCCARRPHPHCVSAGVAGHCEPRSPRHDGHVRRGQPIPKGDIEPILAAVGGGCRLEDVVLQEYTPEQTG